VSQQNPSAQWPLAQTSSEEQAVPFATVPMQAPAVQVEPDAQSALSSQFVAQTDPEQA